MSEGAGDISCMGCGLNCDIESDSKTGQVHCGETQFAVWPNDNHYFKRAINELVFRNLPCYIPKGVVIVDFSLDNILCFLNEQWIHTLRATGLKIILVVEKSMLPMANFWLVHSDFLDSMVVVGSGVTSFVDKIKRVMLGRSPKFRRTPSLTESEMTTLRLLASGHSYQDIAREMACETRNVYRFQYSLCKKFGGMERLRELRFRHAIPSP